MIILSHRGYWIDPREKNTEEAFRRSFDLGFGTETDIRDCLGALVVAHDMPIGSETTLEKFLSVLDNRELPLALNVKADGLVSEIKRVLDAASVRNYFVFDMSIPDMIQYLETGLPVFTRLSEYEREASCYSLCAGVWLDSFRGTWFDERLVKGLLDDGKQVCVVSPELQGRDPVGTWEMLRGLADRSEIMICTDFPERAREFFGG